MTAGDYVIEKYGRRWKLTYPDGRWQRTATRADAVRLCALHAEDPRAWLIEVQGDGADGRHPGWPAP